MREGWREEEKEGRKERRKGKKSKSELVIVLYLSQSQLSPSPQVRAHKLICKCFSRALISSPQSRLLHLSWVSVIAYSLGFPAPFNLLSMP